jgi:hypothetical protein
MMYMHYHKLSSKTYNHSDFKFDLERELFQSAQEDCAVSEEEAEVHTRRSTRRVASGGTDTGTQTMPARLQGHVLTRHHGARCVGTEQSGSVLVARLSVGRLETECAMHGTWTL